MKRIAIIRHQKGQALVEFALVMPILIFFLLGVAEFGWLLNAQISITSAAREGVRAAAVLPTTEAARLTAAQNASINALTGTSGVTLTTSGINYTEVVQADNTKNAVLVLTGTVKPLIGLYVSNPYSMTAKATMRVE